MINVQLLSIQTNLDADGNPESRNFTFEFEDGTHALVGLSGKDLKLDIDKQKTKAAATALENVKDSLKRTQTVNLNEIINVY